MSDIEKLAKVEALLGRLERRKTSLVRRIQESCSHPHEALREAEYAEPSILMHASPPFRVCVLCGYAEEGWGCGYWKLDSNREVPRLSRREAHKHVRRFMNQEALSEVRYGRKPTAKN